MPGMLSTGLVTTTRLAWPNSSIKARIVRPIAMGWCEVLVVSEDFEVHDRWITIPIKAIVVPARLNRKQGSWAMFKQAWDHCCEKLYFTLTLIFSVVRTFVQSVIDMTRKRMARALK